MELLGLGPRAATSQPLIEGDGTKLKHNPAHKCGLSRTLVDARLPFFLGIPKNGMENLSKAHNNSFRVKEVNCRPAFLHSSLYPVDKVGLPHFHCPAHVVKLSRCGIGYLLNCNGCNMIQRSFEHLATAHQRPVACRSQLTRGSKGYDVEALVNHSKFTCCCSLKNKEGRQAEPKFQINTEVPKYTYK
jgi:hypothetical protein